MFEDRILSPSIDLTKNNSEFHEKEFFRERINKFLRSLILVQGSFYLFARILSGLQARLGIMFCYQCVSLVFGLFVVVIHRAKGRRGTALASLKVGAHTRIDIVCGLPGFCLEIIKMCEFIGPVVFVGLFLGVDRGPGCYWLVFICDGFVQEVEIRESS